MRAVVQRVRSAAVSVLGETVAAIGPGMLALVGVADGDTELDALAMSVKIAGLRIFSDEEGRMNRSVAEAGGEVMVVSQFTLLGEVRRGRRPSFTSAAPPDLAEPLVEAVAAGIRASGVDVATGSFGARMSVELVNDGPVTLVLDVRDGKVV